ERGPDPGTGRGVAGRDRALHDRRSRLLRRARPVRQGPTVGVRHPGAARGHDLTAPLSPGGAWHLGDAPGERSRVDATPGRAYVRTRCIRAPGGHDAILHRWKETNDRSRRPGDAL